jgi:hypothetical protein
VLFVAYGFTRELLAALTAIGVPLGFALLLIVVLED